MATGRRIRQPTRTLFAKGNPSHTPSRAGYPYWLLIDSFYNSEDPRFGGSETCVFEDVLEYERGFYQGSRTALIGGIRMRVGRGPWLNLATRREPVPTPDWVETDALRFERGSANGVLLVEHGTTFQKLVAAGAHEKLGLVVVTGGGIPRAPTRRVLHRFHRELNLPVYVLADNDTWGYFLFSVVSRGLIAPHARCPYLAVEKLGFLGLRSGDFGAKMLQQKLFIPWKRHWSLRLRELRKYRCFQSRDWQQELSRFELQRSALELAAVVGRLGASALVDLLQDRLRRRDWLG